MFITKEVIVKERVEVQVPKNLVAVDKDPNLCLLDMEMVPQYNCDGIMCEECYFCLGVVKALTDVPDK